MSLLAALVRAFDEEEYNRIVSKYHLKRIKDSTNNKMQILNLEDRELAHLIKDSLKEEVLKEVYEELSGTIVARRMFPNSRVEVDINALKLMFKNELK